MTENKNFKVSIIIPSYNRAVLLTKAIRSNISNDKEIIERIIFLDGIKD